MPRIRQVARKDIHAEAEPLFQMLFDDRDPVTTPGTGSGTPGNWWTVFAGVADIFDHAVAGFQLYQQPHRMLDAKLRELAQARAGYACASQFVFSQHCKGCRDAGITEEQISAIPAWNLADCFSAVERAVLAYTDALARDNGRVSDAAFASLKHELSDVEILELSYIIGMYVMHAGLSRALRLEYDDVPDNVAEVAAPNGKTGLAETLYMQPDPS